MSDQTYNVKYNIEVESTEATRQLGNFTAAVEALSKFKGDMSGAVENVQNALKAIDKALCTDPSGKGRKYNYKFNIDTKYGEAKLGRIVTALTTIENKSKGINLVVTPGKAFNSKAVQKNAAEIIRHSQEVFRYLSSSTYTTQTSLTRSLGKINSALPQLERSRELNIQTDVAKGRLEEILALLGQVRTAAAAAMPLGRTIVQRAAKEKASQPQTTTQAFLLPPRVQEQLRAVLPRAIPVPDGKESAAAQKRAAAEAERTRKAAEKSLRQQNVETVR